MSTYGRHRQSIVDIEHQLHNIFEQHPNSHVNDSGEPVIPADALVDVFRTFSDVYNGVELMSSNETDMLKALLASNPGLEVTPQILLGFIAEKTRHSPPRSPQAEQEVDLPGRGRREDRDAHDERARSSSGDSVGTSTHRASNSRPPSRGPPETPTSAKGSSPFDVSRRQRANPLGNNAPSSWTKPSAPAHRRKSDAGSRSDSESNSSSPSSFGRAPARIRAPSNPTSPSSISRTSNFSPFNSPPFQASGFHSRPHSRTSSHSQGHLSHSAGFNYGSPGNERQFSLSPDFDEEDNKTAMYNYRGQRNDDFMKSISSLPMPRVSSDSDEEDEDSALGLVMDRSTASSTVSMEPMDRLDALQRSNADMSRKLMEAEQTLQSKLSEHELEFEEMQSRLEEMRSELSATKREEKELRSKERQNTTQIGALEVEILKVTKALEHARSTYTSLQRQYQEQCAASEKYRDDLRQREEMIRNLREAASLHEVETAKWAKEHETYEERIAHLEAELSVAQQAHAQLDEQKQENLLLKETIDRMRFDMDEMRNNAASAAIAGGGSSGQSSAVNTVSKSLGAELLGKMKGGWGMQHAESETEAEEGTSVDDKEEEDTESEDVIQTIITRKKRKVASRANRIEPTTFEEVKEYSDSSTQYDATSFTSSSATQTDEYFDEAHATKRKLEPISRLTVDMEVQTDEFEPEGSRSPSPQEDMASSSSTLVPSTPKAQSLDQLQLSHDQPPAYNQINPQEQEGRDWRVAAETLKKWHRGVNVPFEAIPGGISEEAVEDWKALKEELGVECTVIDKIVAASDKTSHSRPSKDGKLTRRGRFYNIYNTYVYGDGKSASSFPSSVATQAMVWMGASTLFFLAISPYLVPHYSVPGGPTYYDRTAWNSFNTMQAAGEGFSPDGPAAVWSFLGRAGGEAARIVRGWPT